MRNKNMTKREKERKRHSKQKLVVAVLFIVRREYLARYADEFINECMSKEKERRRENTSRQRKRKGDDIFNDNQFN